MSVIKIITNETKAEKMNGRDVLYYLGWNYGWKDGHVKMGHIGKNRYEVTVICEYDTLDSINLAQATTRDVLDYLKETGLNYAATIEDGIIIAIQLIIPVEDGMWEGYESYEEELIKLEEEEN